MTDRRVGGDGDVTVDREVLVAAADLLRAGHDVMLERGRCADGPVDLQGHVCMGIALNAAAGHARGITRTGIAPASVTFAAWGALTGAIGGGAVSSFNDDPATTDDMCFDAFTTAEKALREQAAS